MTLAISCKYQNAVLSGNRDSSKQRSIIVTSSFCLFTTISLGDDSIIFLPTYPAHVPTLRI